MSVNPSRASLGHRLGEIFRFVGAGVVTNIVYFSTLAVLSAVFHEPLWLHAGVAYLFSTITNYWLHYTVTFRSSSGHGMAIRRYIPVQGIALAMNSVILYLLVSHIGMHYLFGQLVAMVATTTWSYLANRNWVFATSRRDA